MPKIYSSVNMAGIDIYYWYELISEVLHRDYTEMPLTDLFYLGGEKNTVEMLLVAMLL